MSSQCQAGTKQVDIRYASVSSRIARGSNERKIATNEQLTRTVSSSSSSIFDAKLPIIYIHHRICNVFIENCLLILQICETLRVHGTRTNIHTNNLCFALLCIEVKCYLLLYCCLLFLLLLPLSIWLFCFILFLVRFTSNRECRYNGIQYSLAEKSLFIHTNNVRVLIYDIVIDLTQTSC